MTTSSGPDASAHLFAIIDGTDDAIISTLLDGTITTWNHGAERLYGYPAGQVLGKNISIVYPDEEKVAIAEFLAKIARRESIHATQGLRRRQDGSLIPVELRINPLYDPDGVIIGASAITRDVSERKRREEELEQSRAFLERTQEIGHIGSWQSQIGPEAMLQLSPESYRILGVDPDHLVRNIDFFNLVYSDDRQLLVETFIKTRNQRLRTELEVRYTRPDGALRWLFLAVDAALDQTGAVTGVTGVVQDITERKDAESSLAHDALHDRLTGLPNRSLLLDRIARAVTRAGIRGSKVAILFADLDRFELFNNTQGHEHGDELLRAVAARLAASIPPTDTVGRFGADEFVLLCEAIDDGADAAERAALTLSLFQEPFAFIGGETFITASIGVVVGELPSSAEALVRDAELAMYQAKQRGRNRYELYDHLLRRQAEQRVALEAGLRRALENGELFLQYQPIASLAEGHFIGAEALIRWNHPERGILAPEDFIEVAEETGLIVPIGSWVMAEACQALRYWQQAAPGAVGLAMSINVSPVQLRQENILAVVADAIGGADIVGSSIWLELTESILVDGALTEDVLRGIRELGPRLSIDDFGTKFSALSYLTRLPIDELKIDQSFVGNAVDDQSDRAVVSAIIALGRSLRLHVTAEGVETAEQLELLRDLGCESAQGLYFSEPVGADACLALLLSGQKGTEVPRAL